MKSHDLYKKGWHPSSEDPGRCGPTRRGTAAPINYAQAPYLEGGCKLLLILYCLNIYLIFIALDIKVCVHNEHCEIILCLFHHVPL